MTGLGERKSCGGGGGHGVDAPKGEKAKGVPEPGPDARLEDSPAILNRVA